jgi:hypothetical protein
MLIWNIFRVKPSDLVGFIDANPMKHFLYVNTYMLVNIISVSVCKSSGYAYWIFYQLWVRR